MSVLCPSLMAFYGLRGIGVIKDLGDIRGLEGP